MAANLKQVVYFQQLPDPSYAELLGARGDIALDRLDYADPAGRAWAALGAAHAYQVSAARDEVPAQYFAGRELLARCPNLLVVSSNGAGYDTVDVDACTAAGVVVVNQAGGNREAVAEHALAMMLCIAKRIIESDRALRREAAVERRRYMGTDLRGKTLGVVGLGNTGGRLAEICRAAFDMHVLAYDPYLAAGQCAERGAEKVELGRLLEEADVVSLHCPRNRETLGLIGAAEFARMRPGAIFVTTARGGIHDEAALEQALAEGRLAGAGLDVWDREPPPPEHPLLRFDTVVASPHTAGVTRESRRNVARIAAEQMIAVLDGARPERLVNPEVWPLYAERFAAILGRRPG